MARPFLTSSFFLLIFLISFSCGKDPVPGPETNGFQREAMLQNFADNLILPAYRKTLADVEELEKKLANLRETASQENLLKARESWEAAYTTWQSACAFNFGPAGESGTRKSLVEEIATFPVSETKLNAILSTGSFNLNDFNRDARGFLALEYLLFGNDPDPARVLETLSSETGKSYLKALAEHLKGRLATVVSEWESAYRSSFVSNKGTDAGSSTSLLYNEFVKSYEILKNHKVGLPLGKSAGQTSTAPQLVEAYYSGKTLGFLKQHFLGIRKIWYGNAFSGNGDGPGFREYLDQVEGGKALIDLTEGQMARIESGLNAIPSTSPFAQQIASNYSQLENLHTELQRHTRYFKSDMSSVLGIAITYSSGDGD